MRTDVEPNPTTIGIPRPQPGEIWQVQGADTLLMIVHVPIAQSTAPAAVAVMLVSRAVEFVSDIDILVPRPQSGDSGGLLALTWQVFDMGQADLAQPIGVRLSRVIYDCLLDIGDRHHGLSSAIVDPAAYGLVGGSPGSHQSAAIQIFHAAQSAIGQSLTQAFQQAKHEFYAEQAMAQLLDAAAQQTIDRTVSRSPSAIELSQWLERRINQPIVAGWERLWAMPLMPQMVPALRSQPTPPDDLAAARSSAIAELIARLQTTTDDETLWAAVESLWKLDPGNPAAGVRRVKLVDLGMQVAGEPVALAVAIVPRGESMAVLLQVYPTGNAAYLPENLQLILLDETGEVLRQIEARPADIYIQLKLSGAIGERFSVRVALGESGLTEHFTM
jgi:Protein of unknown function (DUF1822)